MSGGSEAPRERAGQAAGRAAGQRPGPGGGDLSGLSRGGDTQGGGALGERGDDPLFAPSAGAWGRGRGGGGVWDVSLNQGNVSTWVQGDQKVSTCVLFI